MEANWEPKSAENRKHMRKNRKQKYARLQNEVLRQPLPCLTRWCDNKHLIWMQLSHNQ